MVFTHRETVTCGVYTQGSCDLWCLHTGKPTYVVPTYREAVPCGVYTQGNCNCGVYTLQSCDREAMICGAYIQGSCDLWCLHTGKL